MNKKNDRSPQSRRALRRFAYAAWRATSSRGAVGHTLKWAATKALPAIRRAQDVGQHSDMIRLFVGAKVLALALLVLYAYECAAQAQARTAATDAAPELPDILAGIIHYTRWPEGGATVRLCVNEKYTNAATSMVQRFGRATPEDRPVAVVTRRIETGAVSSLVECEAIYFGDTPAQDWRPLLPELVKHPILTIGRGDDFCSYGGLFCLESTNAGIKLSANLDSIAYSGLRINPQLLRLTQREKTK